MINMVFLYQFCVFLVIISVVAQAQSVTVRPSLCPTNKIAPHKRIGSWESRNERTLFAFYDLLAPNGNDDGFARPPLNSLLEEPQPDVSEDCGEIDDYDENDLTSLAASQRRQGDSRLFLGALLGQQQNQGSQPGAPHVQFPRPQRPQYPPHQRPTYSPPQYPLPDRPQYPPDRPHNPVHFAQLPHRPQYPPQYPQKPQGLPQPIHPPAKPPYASGGFFSNNPYRPPAQQYPSDNIKPVHENNSEAHMIYRPDLVGGPSGHVVGAKPVRPLQRPMPDEPSQDIYQRYPQQRPNQETKDRRERQRRLKSSSSIVGSFIDLLFK